MASPQFLFALRGDESDTLELDVYDQIGASWFSDGLTAKSVRARLKAFQGGTIKLRVNSPGGDVIDGFAIYNLLSEHPARVEADVDALAASMASVILMAADEIRVTSNALVMIHEPWGVAFGGSDDMRATAGLLDKMRDSIADAYAARTGQPKSKVLQMMADETWLTAAEAKELGFADKVKSAKKGKRDTAQARAFASLNLSGFDAVPEHLRQLVERARDEIGRAAADCQSDENEVSPSSEQEIEMADDVKTILATLGVASVQEAASRLSILARIEAATTKSGDEAHGVVLAAMASHGELPKLQARIAELEKGAESSALDALIAKAKEERKLTPALEKTVRDQFSGGDITLKGAEAFLGSLTPIAALNARSAAAPASSGTSAPAPVWSGKTYAELRPAQRAQLKREDPELYAAMSAQKN